MKSFYFFGLIILQLTAFNNIWAQQKMICAPFFENVLRNNARDIIQIDNLNFYATGDSQKKVVTDSGSVSKAKEAKKIIYKCWVYSDSAGKRQVYKGFIHEALDSELVISVAKTGNNFMNKKRQLIHVKISNVRKISLRKNGSAGNGILAGAGIGFLSGTFLGLLGIPDYGILSSLPREENGLVGGILFIPSGMLVGGIIKSARIKIPIAKDQVIYEQNRQMISGYTSTGKILLNN
jgi:hypothetical protein